MPKTAGTAMRQSLMQSFPAQDVAACYRIGHVVEDLQEGILQGKKLIIGHIDFSHLNQVKLPDEYQLLCIFRDPIERVISTHLHFQHHTDPLYSTWSDGEVSFSEFMKSHYAHNWTCQFLGGAKRLLPPASQEEKLLNLALQNLSKLAWVGISERFQDSLFSLSIFLQQRLKNPGIVNRNSHSKQHRLLKKEYGEVLLTANSGDYEIYEKVSERFDEQLRAIPNYRLKRWWFNVRA